MIRPFGERDADAIEAIVDATYGGDSRVRALHGASHGPPLDAPFRRTLVADADGTVVAAGTVFHGRFHPLHSSLAIEVAPPFRRRGVGTALLHELRSLAPAPLLARVRLDQEAGVPFLEGHGFRLLNRSWEGRVDPAVVSAPRAGRQATATPSLDDAATFFERWYRSTHEWDPPATMSTEQARAVFCGDNLVERSLVGVRDAERLLAAAALIRPPVYDPGDELYLVWIGALESEDEAAATVLAACVDFARDAQKALRFEVDESNAPVHRALERLGVLGEPALAFFAEDT